MAKKPSGNDAVDITPKFVPDEKLHGRDDSGGEGYEPRTAEFGDGGVIKMGSKPHLSPGGKD
jgi:hypothetical protein